MLNQARSVLIFTIIVWAIATLSAVMLGTKEFMLYLGLAPFLIAGMSFLHMRVKFPVSLLWCFSFLIVVHCLGGLITLPDHFLTEGKSLLYNYWIIPHKLKYDEVIHTYGNAIATWMCWDLLRYSISLAVKKDIKEIPAHPIFLILCFLAGVGIGALNELIEFGATQAVPGDHNVGGYVNTGWDLVSNTLGGGVAIFLIWIKRRDKPMPTPKPVKHSHSHKKSS